MRDVRNCDGSLKFSVEFLALQLSLMVLGTQCQGGMEALLREDLYSVYWW